MITSIFYTTTENKLVIITGIEAVGQLTKFSPDEMQDNYYDEEKNLIRVEITTLQRLPKMEQDRMIAEFYAEPEERAAAKKAADKLAAEKAAQVEKDRKAAEKAERKRLADEAAGAEENQVQIPTAKATVAVIDEFANRYAIDDLEEYQNAKTKAEKLAVIEANFIPPEVENNDN